MAQRSLSIEMRTDVSHSGTRFMTAEKNGRRSDLLRAPVLRTAFATRAQARLLVALGWRLSAWSRHEMESQAPLQCCFVLRDGSREEAGFGYTAVTMPDDANCPTLGKAKSHVERFLARLGEDSGVLVQNTPLFAFGGRRRERVAVFGGWRFRRGAWTPFLLGPNGLSGVADQDVLFARGTAPHHMAEVCGHASQAIMPRIANLARVVETLGQSKARIDGVGKSEPDSGELQIEPYAAGWFMARPGRPGATAPVLPDARSVSVLEPTHVTTAGQTTATALDNDALKAFGSDEFRFHEFGVHRK